VKWLVSIDVNPDRAEAGVRLAVMVGRLVDTPSGIAIPTFDQGLAA
jgi:hypothetical protein